ncbi:hypothetical protein BJ170DRAFT_115979 [Xylariales sp. AK1849]|nr:hypothetical protein BJ170DRAFT_115979 [Xylariales sp. AK1849]
MPRAPKRPGPVNCRGCGCGNPKCCSCRWSGDDDSSPERENARPLKKARGDPAGPLSVSSSSMPRRAERSKRSKGQGCEWCGEPDCSGCNLSENLETDVDADDVPRGDMPRQAPSPSTPAGTPSFADMVDALDEQTVRKTLVRLASMAPSAQSAIKQAYALHQRERLEPPKAIDFDHYSKQAWHALNTSDYEDFGSAGTDHAWAQVVRCVKGIGQQTRSDSSFKTKQSALETLRKIMKSILLSGDSTLGHEVLMKLKTDQRIVTTMRTILASMDERARIRVGRSADDKGALWVKVKWVRDEAMKRDLKGMQGLDRVLKDFGEEPEIHWLD